LPTDPIVHLDPTETGYGLHVTVDDAGPGT